MSLNSEKKSSTKLEILNRHLKNELDLAKKELNVLTGNYLQNLKSIEEKVNEKSRDILEREKWFREIFNNTLDVLLCVNADGFIIDANSQACKFYDYPYKQITGLSVGEIVSLEKYNYILNVLKEKTNTAEIIFEDIHLTKSRKEYNVEVKGKLVTIKGELIFFIAARDITLRKIAEKEKNKLENQLSHTRKMEALGTLAGGIAHDFNNILTSILLNTELALGEVYNNCDLNTTLSQIKDSGHRAKELIEQIVMFSNKSPIGQKLQDISFITTNTLKMLKVMIPFDIIVKIDIAFDTGAILGDQTQIQQLVMNLCINAIHSMKEKGGVLKVKLDNLVVDNNNSKKLEIEHGEYVRLSVIDNGCGMPPEVVEHIFDPFFTTKPQGEGSGLGLSVVHGVVTQNNGTIIVESEINKGTSFYVFFRKQNNCCDSGIDQQNTASHKTNKTADYQNNSLEKKNILFVDDDQDIVNVNKKILEYLGYNVTTSSRSPDALEIFRNCPQKFDVVMTDVTMPEMNGIDLTKELLKIRKDVLVIICSGYNSHTNETKIKSIGAKGFIMKPASIKSIDSIIKEVLTNDHSEEKDPLLILDDK